MTTADLLAVPHEITHEGTTYKLSPPDLEMQATYSRWLEKRAREDAGRAALDLPNDVAAEYMSGARRDIAAGIYEWGSPVCVASLGTMVGMVKVIELMMLPNHPDADAELARKIVSAKMHELSAVLAGNPDDPKVKAVATIVAAAKWLFSSPTNPSTAPLPKSAS